MNKQEYAALGFEHGRVGSKPQALKAGTWQHTAYMDGYDRGCTAWKANGGGTKQLMDSMKAQAKANKPGRAVRDAERRRAATVARIEHRAKLHRLDRAKPRQDWRMGMVTQNIKRAGRDF